MMDFQSQALLERASALRRAGRVEEAIAEYRRLLEREPDDPDSWYNLGWLQRQARHYAQSLDSYAEALGRGVSDPEEVHLNRAVILSDDLGRPDEAESELAAALSLRPTYVPALLNLGNLHEDRGDRAAAQAAYRRALAVEPDNALALSRLAGVVDAKGESSAELVDELGRRLSSAPSPVDRADLGFALGRLLDARGAYDEAFAAYQQANLASRESFGPAFAGYDRQAAERFVDESIAAFSAPVQPAGAGGSPIFICGMFRSGSTLVEQILGSHSRVAAGGELDLIPALAAQIPGYPRSIAGADPKAIDSWRSFYGTGAAPFAREGRLLTDKRPDNVLHVGLIKTLFPDSKVVLTRRDRLDNLLSLYFLQLGPAMPFALDLRDSAHWHDQQQRLSAHWKQLYPNDIFEIDYDLLVREPRAVLDPLLQFLGLDWEKGLLDFYKREGAVKTASVWQVREPLHGRSSGRWRNYSRQLGSRLGEPVRG